MKVVILAGGYGTRLTEYTSDIPKPLVKIGNEPILTLDNERIVDSKGRVSRVTTAGNAPSVGEYVLMSYLPPEYAVEGTKLQVMYMNEVFPVEVAVVGSGGIFDPDDLRMKG